MEVSTFYPMSQRPVAEESDGSFSKTVIIYGEKSNDAGLGYFDFEMDEWLHLGDTTFLLKCWCYLPDPVEVKNNDWEVIAPKGYQRYFL